MRKDIDFFSGYRTTADHLYDKFKIISLSLLIGSLVIVLLISGFLGISDLSVRHTIGEMNSYLQSPEVVQAKKTVQTAQSEISALNNYKQAAENVIAGYYLFPKIDSALFKTVASMQPSDVKTNSIAYNGTILTLTCTCDNPSSPAIFVHSLETSGKFESVNYSTVASARDNSGHIFYNFTVLITLKGGDEK